MAGNDQKDCCCICLSVRTGVIIIGGLLWVGLIFLIGQIVWLLMNNDDGEFYQYYLFPQAVIELVLGIMFCRLMSAENSERDWEVRKQFARSYLILAVIVNGALSIAGFVVGYVIVNNYCDEQIKENPQHAEDIQNICDGVKSTYMFGFWITFGLEMLWEIYCSYVCK